MRQLCAVFWLAALSACQTTGSAPQPVTVPADIAAAFSNCSPGDGSVVVQVATGDTPSGSLDANWVAESRGDWQVELTDGFGRTVLAARRAGANVGLSGSLAAKAPRVSQGDGGILEVSGHRVGIKASEVPCLLRYAWPKTWLTAVDDVTTDGGVTTVHITSAGREITYGVQPPDGVPAAARCAQIRWRHWLFFKQELVWCQTQTPPKTGWLRGLSAYSLKWTSLDAP